MIPVKRLGHATFNTPDVARLAEYYEHIVGFEVVERTPRRAILATAMGQETLVLEQATDTHCPRLAFGLDPAFDLADGVRQLTALGIASEIRTSITPGIGKALAFKDPKGTLIEAFTDYTPVAGSRAGQGIAPLKFGHIAFNADTARTISEFYCGVLGFRVSDWIENVFAFLRCGPDHHTCNFIDGPPGVMHHLAFELRDWAHVLTALDTFGMHGRKIIWGPGRHRVGHNIFIYTRDPDDHIVEMFCDIDLMKDETLGYFEPRPWHEDRPQRPKQWTFESGAPLWGLPPSDDFRRSGQRHLPPKQG
jgi:catechol 2,3-dioxygenase-like lactoylglutathione lyase family enzyme